MFLLVSVGLIHAPAGTCNYPELDLVQAGYWLVYDGLSWEH